MSKRAKTSISREIRIFWVGVISANIALLGGVILQINSQIHQNSISNDYRKQITILTRDNDLLQTKLAQSDSLENFDQNKIAAEKNYEKVTVDAIKFVRASGSQLASIRQ